MLKALEDSKGSLLHVMFDIWASVKISVLDSLIRTDTSVPGRLFILSHVKDSQLLPILEDSILQALLLTFYRPSTS